MFSMHVDVILRDLPFVSMHILFKQCGFNSNDFISCPIVLNSFIMAIAVFELIPGIVDNMMTPIFSGVTFAFFSFFTFRTLQ